MFEMIQENFGTHDDRLYFFAHVIFYGLFVVSYFIVSLMIAWIDLERNFGGKFRD